MLLEESVNTIDLVYICILQRSVDKFYCVLYFRNIQRLQMHAYNMSHTYLPKKSTAQLLLLLHSLQLGRSTPAPVPLTHSPQSVPRNKRKERREGEGGVMYG